MTKSWADSVVDAAPATAAPTGGRTHNGRTHNSRTHNSRTHNSRTHNRQRSRQMVQQHGPGRDAAPNHSSPKSRPQVTAAPSCRSTSSRCRSVCSPGRSRPIGSSTCAPSPNGRSRCWPAGSSGTSTRQRRVAGSPRCCRPCSPTAAAPGWTPDGWCCRAIPEFFAITKRLHNRLHGAAGDGGPLGEAEHAHYEKSLADNLALIRGPDAAGRHRTAARPAVGRPGRGSAGDRVPSWSGAATSAATPTNEHSEQGWEFLRRYVERRTAFIFSRAAYAPDWVPADRLWVIPPSIDPFAAKNREIETRRGRRHPAPGRSAGRCRCTGPTALHPTRRQPVGRSAGTGI